MIFKLVTLSGKERSDSKMRLKIPYYNHYKLIPFFWELSYLQKPFFLCTSHSFLMGSKNLHSLALFIYFM